MELSNKKALVVGMGRSGKASKTALIEKGCIVELYDGGSREKLDDETKSQLASGSIIGYFDGQEPEQLTYDFVVISPGVPIDIPLMNRVRAAGIEILGELELAYRIAKGIFIAITGTNGKTTTTTLVYEICKAAGKEAVLVGNIGNPVVNEAVKSTDNTWFITEISSFQLESIHQFTPKISAILNITPDHLDRHGSLENYAATKARIFENQKKADEKQNCTQRHIFVPNFDDKMVWRQMALSKCSCWVYPFSRKEELEAGCYIKDGKLMIAADNKLVELCAISELQIPGDHNVENALAAAMITYAAGIEPAIIGKAIKAFQGVEHRLEFVSNVNGIRFVNDSKGTNPDASIKAIEAMTGKTVLIAGGYDKGSEFDQLINSFGDKIKHLVLFGKTAQNIKETAERLGFHNITMASDMKESVEKAYDIAKQGETVLLSPACASWDMYTCFEERGEDFKQRVKGLK